MQQSDHENNTGDNLHEYMKCSHVIVEKNAMDEHEDADDMSDGEADDQGISIGMVLQVKSPNNRQDRDDNKLAVDGNCDTEKKCEDVEYSDVSPIEKANVEEPYKVDFHVTTTYVPQRENHMRSV